MEMTASRIDALVASAFNLAAADQPSLRSLHVNGMSPAVAAALPATAKVMWVESYARRLNAGELKKHEPLMYGAAEAKAALEQLGQGV